MTRGFAYQWARTKEGRVAMRPLSEGGIPSRGEPRWDEHVAVDSSRRLIPVDHGPVFLPSARFTNDFKDTVTRGEWRRRHEATYGARHAQSR